MDEEYDADLAAQAFRPMRNPQTIRCGCGHRLRLDDPWSNACTCGELYNGAGQHLAPVQFWGEETGEKFT